MKQKVSPSSRSTMLTFVVSALLLSLIYYFYSRHETVIFCIMAGCTTVYALCSLLFMPMSVELDDRNLTVNMPLRYRRFPVSEIAAVKRYTPAMGEHRLLGSGGYCGYWGWFSNREIGKYFAYYGQSSDCFLILMRNGRRYMLGCKNPDEMVKAISGRIGQ